MTQMMNDWSTFDYLSLSTKKRDGTWVDTPVWFAFDGDKSIYCFSEGKAGKIKRLRNFSDVKINPCTFSGRILGEWETASAHILTSENDVNIAYETLKNNYGWQMRILNLISRLAGKIEHRAFIKIEL